MSTPFASASIPVPVPATKEFSAAWIAYVLYTVSSILMWPAVIALVISYVKRGRPETGFIDSHHRWMLRSFWYSQIAFLVFFVLVIAGVWPLVSDVVLQAIDAVQSGQEPAFNAFSIPWGTLFTTAGVTMLGGCGIAVTWFWYIYRMLRGMIALADARALP